MKPVISNGYSLSFPNFNEFSCREPPISRCTRCRCSDRSCRRCREPCVQQWILQCVQGAFSECCRAECRACSEKSAFSHLRTVDFEPRASALFTSHMSRSCSLSRCRSWPSNSAVQNSSTNVFFPFSLCVECMYGCV